MMGIVVPETCWASNKICNKNLCCICWHFISTDRFEIKAEKSNFEWKCIAVLAHRAETWDFIIRDYPSSAYKRLNFENVSAAAVDPRLRPRGHWNRHLKTLSNNIYYSKEKYFDTSLFSRINAMPAASVFLIEYGKFLLLTRMSLSYKNRFH